jgi:hypothetical protein
LWFDVANDGGFGDGGDVGSGDVQQYRTGIGEGRSDRELWGVAAFGEVYINGLHGNGKARDIFDIGVVGAVVLAEAIMIKERGGR